MNIAVVSCASLVVAVIVGGVARVNVGVVALGFAWLIGYYVVGLPVTDVVAGFPLGVATALFGITLLFSQAHQNGTLDALTLQVLRVANGHRSIVPIMFFFIALVVATVGPGNIAAVALLAPLAMAVAGRTGISAFLMTVMVANGANAGAFSPFAPTGIIANGLIAKQGLQMHPWTQVYLPSLVAQTLIALLAYVCFGGLALWRSPCAAQHFTPVAVTTCNSPALNRSQWFTLGAIGALIVGVVVCKADIGFLAITLAAVVAALGMADGEAALKAVPWDTIMMVCGVSVLVAIVETTGGMDVFTALLARVAAPHTITGVIALVTGALSAYSSSSGVVMPTFIPLVPDLIARMGGGDPVAIISAINVGSHVVDVSPLSTLGAMCIAHAAAHENRQRLFQALLLYSVSMAGVGAVVCYVVFGLLW